MSFFRPQWWPDTSIIKMGMCLLSPRVTLALATRQKRLAQRLPLPLRAQSGSLLNTCPQDMSRQAGRPAMCAPSPGAQVLFVERIETFLELEGCFLRQAAKAKVSGNP